MKIAGAVLGVAIGSLALFGSAQAADDATTGYRENFLYLGADYGWYKAKGGDFDDNRNMVDALVGYQFNNYIGLDASFVDFGRFHTSDDVSSAKVDGYTLGLTLGTPVGALANVYLRGGYLLWHSQVKQVGFRDSVDDSDPFYGVGVQVRLSQLFGIVAEYDRYEVRMGGSSFGTPVRANADLDVGKVGIRLNF